MTDLADERPTLRWEGDEHGRGIGDGRALAPNVQRLLDALTEPHWLAEEPEAHLLPHLEHGARPWQLVDADVVDGGVYQVTLTREGGPARLGGVRPEAFAIIGRLAEKTTCITERLVGDTVEYEVATGILEGDTHWLPHGHLLRLVLTGDGVQQAVRGARPVR